MYHILENVKYLYKIIINFKELFTLDKFIYYILDK